VAVTILDQIVFYVFIIGVVAFGCSFYFKSRSTENFTKGGQSMPSWVVGMSIFAIFVSSISFLGLPGQAYESNWNPFVFSLSIPLATVLAAWVFVPLYRSLNSASAYNYLEVRFGYWARAYAAVCYLLTQIARTGSIMFLMALPMNYMLGWSIPTIILVTGICVLVYSAIGGIKAVIYTDTVMGIILIAGAVTCVAVLMFTMPEGPKQLFQIAAEHEKFSLGSFKWSWTEPTFWLILVYGTFINLQNYGVDQNYVQRYLTTSSVREARNSTLFGGLLYVPVSLLFVFIGTALFSYFTAQPELLPDGLAGDRVFPYFIIHGLPPGITGLLIASIFAAGMSTVSTSVNSSATVILTDFVNRLSPKGITEKRNMKVLYITSAILGVLGVLVGLAMMRVQGVLDAWWKLSSIFSGGMLGLFLLGFVVKKARNPQALTGVIVGILVIAWMSLSPLIPDGSGWVMFRSSLHLNLTIVFGTTAIFLVGFVLTLLAKPKTEITFQPE